MTLTREITSILLRGARWYTHWLTAAQLVVIVVAAVINGRVNDPVAASVWQWPAAIWVRYPLVGVGATLGTASLPLFVAHGVTRRQFLRGASVFCAVVLAVLVVMGIAGFLLERLVYELGGFEVALEQRAPLWLGTVYLLLLGCYLVTGVLIGAALSRWSPRKAPFMITLFVVPMIVGELALGTFWGGVERGDLRRDLSLAVSAPIVIAVITAAAAIGYVLLRDVALKPKKG